jgi:hypothetical protein
LVLKYINKYSISHLSTMRAKSPPDIENSSAGVGRGKPGTVHTAPPAALHNRTNASVRAMPLVSPTPLSRAAITFAEDGSFVAESPLKAELREVRGALKTSLGENKMVPCF